MKILAIIPVHNRRETTLRMLSSLQHATLPAGVELSVCIVDDGSTDGTATAIKADFPDIEIERGDGSLFWSGCVRRGIDLFMDSGHSHMWLLNDDLVLDENCLSELVKFARENDPWVVSATVTDKAGNIIYGGIKRRPFFRFRKAGEGDYVDGICRTEAVNGNCLLVSCKALEAFRLPPPELYRQEGLDMYIGLEATRLGHMPYIVREAICHADLNTTKMWFYEAGRPLSERIRGVMGPKGLPPAMYWDFCRRFSGPLAPLLFMRPFLRVVFPKKLRRS